jgi:outer membrane protein OmpA-like peptidoglycan-associated protein
MRFFITALLCLSTLGLSPASEARKKRLKIQIAMDDVDLKARRLYFRLNKPAESAELKLYTPEGRLVGEKVELFHGASAGKKLSLTWPDVLKDTDNFRLELRVSDTDSFWVTWEIVRFYMEIPHEDVVFETGKWEVRPKEMHKLEAALQPIMDTVKKYGKLVKCHLYVAGHTDTVGSNASNRELSRKRAHSIARYFKSHGLRKVPVYVRGFGEEALAVKTGDNVDEERNRRAQYIVATFPPDMPGPGGWQRVQ